MSIENLSNEKKEQSIQYIVEQGIVNPKMRWLDLKNKIEICSIRTAFYGINDCIFLGIIISVILWCMFLQIDTKLIGCGVSLLSPLLYLIIYSLVVWKEMLGKFYEMKMVCKYNLQLLSSFRMLYFSVVNLILNTMAIFMMQISGIKNIHFLNLLGISFSAIFLYGIVVIFLRWKMRTVISQLICSMIWLVIHVLFICFGGQIFEKFLMNLSIYVVMTFVVVSGTVYLSMLFLNVTKRIEGEMEYAFR